MKIPFQFGRTVIGDAFTNREKEIKRLLTNFTNNQNTIILSPRRWGKTSMVKMAVTRLKRKDKTIIPCHLDMFNTRNEEEFYSYFATEVIKSSSNKVEEWIDAGKSLLSRIGPKFSFGSDPINDFSVKFEMGELKENYLDILNLPEKIAKRKKNRILICIDEFQNIGSFSESMSLQKRLRASWQNHQAVSYCLYGSKRHMMMQLFESQSSPFYKFGDVIYLNKISHTDLTQFIIEGFRKTDKHIPANLASDIVNALHCHPYYVQQLSYLVWVNTQKKVNEKITIEAINELLDQNSILFQKTIESLSNSQVNFLKALASGIHNNFSSSKIIREFNLGTSGNVVKIKKKLEKNEITDSLEDKLDFLDPCFKLWFKRDYLKTPFRTKLLF